MPRVKRGKVRATKRKRLLKQTKGYKWRRKSSVKQAKEAVKKAGAYSYRDRRVKKRTARSLWQVKINAALREQGLTYSKFMGDMKKKKIELDRKILADLAENNPEIFKAIIKQVK